MLGGASSAVIVASGGRELFLRFRAAPEALDDRADPLDRFTRAAVEAAVGEVLGDASAERPDGVPGDAAGARGPTRPRYRLFFPFVVPLGPVAGELAGDPDGHPPALPFQRLGRAAGLGAPGPLGLQIHPHYGPWWAYRALIVLAGDSARASGPRQDASQQALSDGCAGCDAPCVAACPGDAVRLGGFSIADCHAHRLVAAGCRLSCVSRIRCVRGPAERYTDDQLAFHMKASMPASMPASIPVTSRIPRP